MATTGTGTEDVSPPTKRVRMNPADIKDGPGQSDGATGARSSQDGPSSASRPAFLTPPTSASIPAPPPSSSADAVLTHDNLCSSAASSSPKAGHSRAFVTPRGGGGGGASHKNNCDSGRSPAGLMSKRDNRNLMQREAGYDIDDPQNVPKREGYLTWDDYFMAVASLSAQRSKDPHSQVGACIVDEDNRIVGIGYNGFPRGCPDDCLPWAANTTSSSGASDSGGNQNEEKKGDDDDNASLKQQPQQPLSILHTRDPFMCHAEVNAILNKCSADVAGSRMYVARFPCNECAKVIIQSRIREVVYLEDGPGNGDSYRAARIMFQMAGVSMRKYTATRNSIMLDFGPLVSEKKDDATSSSNIFDRGGGKDGGGPCASIDQAKYRDLLVREANYDPVGPSVVPKRGGYLSWDTYFMAVSFLSAQRSKDPNTQVGACIVDGNKCVIGIGYNGFPRCVFVAPLCLFTIISFPPPKQVMNGLTAQQQQQHTVDQIVGQSNFFNCNLMLGCDAEVTSRIVVWHFRVSRIP
mmetsp:Transcript_753/g.2106  ORF Transcript_753/g.2106 Transcript_753/m.2106 type:complete len:522 (-) Transcript_753:480-2045(-)